MIRISLFVILFCSTAGAHIRITPQGRMGMSDAFKFVQNNAANPTVPDNPGPCSTLTTRSATPLVRNIGQTLSIQIQETINHPGRFIVQFSPANEQNFWLAANQLANVADNQNNGTTTVNVTLPNTPCTNCTLRVLQQMDDQPGEFYVHCVDMNLVDPNATPAPTATPATGLPDVGKSNTNLSSDIKKPGFGGCGTIRNHNSSSPTSGTWLLLIPVLALFWIRQRAFRRGRVTICTAARCK